MNRLPISVLVLLSILFGSVSGLRAADQKIAKKVLENGLTVIVKPEAGSGLVSVSAVVKVGAGQESIQTAGIGFFVSRLLLASTRAKSAEQVASIADEVGGNITASWLPDVTNIRAITTSAGFDKAMNLIGDCLSEANFEAHWVEQQRKALLLDLKRGNENAFERAYDALRQSLYEDNGYRRPYNTSDRAVTLATPLDLQKFYSMYYVPNNLVLSVAGDVTVEHAIKQAERAFAGVVAKKLPVDRGVPDEKLDRYKFSATESDVSAAHLLIGWLAPAVGSPDYPAFAVLSTALGGGKGSMLFQELRQKQGIGYEIGTLYPKLKYQSHLVAYVVTDPFKAALPGRTPDLVLQEAKDTIVRLAESLKVTPLPDEDLERAKGFTIGAYALSHQHLAERAYLLGWAEAAGVGYGFDSTYADRVDKITAADVQRVAAKYLTSYSAVLILPKPQSVKAKDTTSGTAP